VNEVAHLALSGCIAHRCIAISLTTARLSTLPFAEGRMKALSSNSAIGYYRGSGSALGCASHGATGDRAHLDALQRVEVA
jgi:hypothetical protein